MALNPFFLQGSASEQRLVQDLINEQLKMYGVEVIYIPRKFVNKKTIIEEVRSSRFDDNFYLEAYLNTYDGYSGAGDILTKFGMSLRDELTLTISKERFEDFISPFMSALDDGTGGGEMVLSIRPREGDLIYFPLGERIFEVKFVEHEQPFYQLGRNYVYELKCELFEYEDEVIDTTIQEIDTQIQDEGYITTLSLIGIGVTAQASSIMGTGYVDRIYLNNDGSGYTSPPKVIFSPSPTGFGGDTASAVAIGTYKGRIFNLQDIYLISSGIGYTAQPTITISGSGGAGAAATCSVVTDGSNGVIRTIILDVGLGYATRPTITFTPPSVGAAATATVGVGGTISRLTITNPGISYISSPLITISSPPTGIGSTATATASISGGIVTGLVITNPGFGYITPPTVTISNDDLLKDSRLKRATGVSSITSAEGISAILITNPGIGYTAAPQVIIGNPDILTGYGNYNFNEIVVGSNSKTKARVKEWDYDTKILKISYVGIGATTKGFVPGESITGTESGAIYSVKTFEQMDTYDKYSQNKEIENEADFIVDFSESNPFGTY